ncbi:phosphoribosylglycinamide formyltransferase [Steroidobacter agaridevorans]|uniref:Phosphoribosylglycinamide formyltransferase n=1 Tax=Steroidobacter agaridevorans TaxID=2695856 RepID=A0A829YPZ1_9GAMM|nr:phosphoribosylglycinamide formyltransferase [Steroidobacter agaridevorans]GFE84536.1 phosphoribosylglycinamide formyltransferase [Steroidobacter agaridevorans]GFE90935.1 phosphoribosylglycinamide formyltransferase [Steroidobacter agaridevorans]
MTSVAGNQPHNKLPIVILISGRGSNMLAIAERAANGELPVEVRAVISDKADAAGLATAAAMNIPTRSLSAKEFADRASYDRALAALVQSFEPELIVLAGFMRILSPGFIAAFADRILNIHPSLLPLYRGLHTHRRALEAGDILHGCSVHFVTEELDGGPLVIQSQVKVLPGDSESSLSARVQQQEHRIYSQAIDWFARRRLQLREQQAWLDGRPLDAPVIQTASD